MPRLPLIDLSNTKVAVLGWILVIVVGGISFTVYGPVNQSGAGDALDYAAMGRNLARGEGFTTSAIYPLQLSDAMNLISPHEFNPRDIPNLHRPPLLPLGYSVAYRFFGESELIFPAVSVFFYILLLSLVWNSSGPGTHSRATVVAILALFPPLVRQLPSGLAEIPAAVFCLAASILSIERKRSAFGSIALGLLSGAAFLTKSYLLLLLPAFAIYLWIEGRGEGRLRAILLLVLGWTAVSTPWLIRNWIVTGSPFFTLQAFCEISKGIPGYEAFRAHRGLEPIPIFPFVWNHPKEIMVKAISSLFICARSDFGSNLLVWVCGIFVWWRLRNKPVDLAIRKLLALFLLLSGFLAVALAPINLEPRYLLPTLFPIWVLSMVGMARVVEGSHFSKYLILLLVYFTVANFAGFLRTQHAADRRADVPFLSARIPENGLVVTDADGFVAWFADRPSLWLPSDEGALEWVLDRYPVQGVYLQEGLESPYLIHYDSTEVTFEGLRERFERHEQTPAGGLLLY